MGAVGIFGRVGWWNGLILRFVLSRGRGKLHQFDRGIFVNSRGCMKADKAGDIRKVASSVLNRDRTSCSSRLYGPFIVVLSLFLQSQNLGIQGRSWSRGHPPYAMSA